MIPTFAHQRSRPIRILLVEDNKGDAILVRRAFERCTVMPEIQVARTGHEALNIANSWDKDSKPDIIMLDINLPGISGHEVLSTFKAHPQHRYIPVLMLSSSLAASDIMESYQAHANCYIAKPHDFENLCAIMHQIEAFWFSFAVLPDESIRRAA